MKSLLSPPTFEDFLRLLRAWRLWFLGALLGGLLGLALYAIFPPDYRARASVSVDFNVEQNWSDIPDREVFYFLDREARKLQEIAWSDGVLGQVTEQTGAAARALRSDALTLSQPADGAWHFYADSADAALAEKMASAWAQAFVAAAQVAAPQFTITASQIEQIPLSRALPRGIYALAGAALGLAALAFWALFRADQPPQ